VVGRQRLGQPGRLLVHPALRWRRPSDWKTDSEAAPGVPGARLGRPGGCEVVLGVGESAGVVRGEEARERPGEGPEEGEREGEEG